MTRFGWVLMLLLRLRRLCAEKYSLVNYKKKHPEAFDRKEFEQFFAFVSGESKGRCVDVLFEELSFCNVSLRYLKSCAFVMCRCVIRAVELLWCVDVLFEELSFCNASMCHSSSWTFAMRRFLVIYCLHIEENAFMFLTRIWCRTADPLNNSLMTSRLKGLKRSKSEKNLKANKDDNKTPRKTRELSKSALNLAKSTE